MNYTHSHFADVLESIIKEMIAQKGNEIAYARLVGMLKATLADVCTYLPSKRQDIEMDHFNRLLINLRSTGNPYGA